MNTPFGKHPACRNPKCSGGIVRTTTFGPRDCPDCEAHRRRELVATSRAVQGRGTRGGERQALAAWHRSQGRVATAILIETACDESEDD